MTTPRVLLWGALAMASEGAAAHGGGLDANGCHHDRKHGGYHCHRGAALPAPASNFAPASAPPQRLSRSGDATTPLTTPTAARPARRVPRRYGVAIPGMRGIWIEMAMAWAANRNAGKQRPAQLRGKRE